MITPHANNRGDTVTHWTFWLSNFGEIVAVTVYAVYGI